jgi:hypothetical protein
MSVTTVTGGVTYDVTVVHVSYIMTYDVTVVLVRTTSYVTQAASGTPAMTYDVLRLGQAQLRCRLFYHVLTLRLAQWPHDHTKS